MNEVRDHAGISAVSSRLYRVSARLEAVTEVNRRGVNSDMRVELLADGMSHNPAMSGLSRLECTQEVTHPESLLPPSIVVNGHIRVLLISPFSIEK